MSWRIGTRLLIAQALVLLAAVVTAGLIASLVGPSLFHAHLLEANEDPNPSEIEHVEEAYRAANAISLGVAMVIAIAIALAVSWYLSRRFQSPLTQLTRAAIDMSTGRYEVRVPERGAAPEIDQLATAFNAMSSQLAHTEETRRRLLSDLAHELRTPVATLSAYLEGLEDGVATWDSHTMATLVDQVDRLSRLATDIDAVSRAEEGRMSMERADLDVGDCVDAAVRTCRGQFTERRVSLTTIPGPPVTLSADRARVQQVLTNLLQNACRHTPSGGQVTVSWDTDGEDVALSVADTGDGIAAAHLPHIFERFYRGDSARDREHGGSGIGLTISKAILEAHGGHLTAISAGPGTGSRFVATFPGAQRPPTVRQSPDAPHNG